jgi:hypothetical protein
MELVTRATNRPGYDQRERRWRHLDLAGMKWRLRYTTRRVHDYPPANSRRSRWRQGLALPCPQRREERLDRHTFNAFVRSIENILNNNNTLTSIDRQVESVKMDVLDRGFRSDDRTFE